MTEREKNIERGLELAGRDKVFALVRALGWSPSDIIPHFVWEQAIAQALSRPETLDIEAKDDRPD